MHPQPCLSLSLLCRPRRRARAGEKAAGQRLPAGPWAALHFKISSDGPKREPEPCDMGVQPSTPQQRADRAWGGREPHIPPSPCTACRSLPAGVGYQSKRPQ